MKTGAFGACFTPGSARSVDDLDALAEATGKRSGETKCHGSIVSTVLAGERAFRRAALPWTQDTGPGEDGHMK